MINGYLPNCPKCEGYPPGRLQKVDKQVVCPGSYDHLKGYVVIDLNKVITPK